MAKIFNPDRYGFIAIGESIIAMERGCRDMATADWANQVLGVDQTDLIITTRGYITPDRIQFFTNDYTTDTSVTAELVEAAYATYMQIYGGDKSDAMTVPVFNGVKVGKVGETWPPCLVWKPADKRWCVA